MRLYVARRLAETVVLLVVVVVVTFVLVSLAPGDTAQVLAGASGSDPEYLALLREKLGLDRPLPYQIGAYLLDVLRGDLGFSAVRGRPVAQVIFDRLPATLLLGVTALTLSTVAGVLLGVVSAARRGSALDTAISTGSLLAYSVPVFWLGQLLIALLAVRLGWLPTGGMTSTGGGGALDVVRHLLLPAATLALVLLGLVVRTTRAAMIDVLGEDYVTAARARGLREDAVLFGHALRTAARPVITVVSSEVAILLSVMVLIETVFAWPGLGRLLLDSVLSRDTPMLVGILIFSSFVVAAVNLLADLLSARLDPRIVLR